MNFLQYLICPKCSTQFTGGVVQTLCRCGSPLLVEYDLEQARRSLARSALNGRPATMWRYAELLPVQNDKNIVSLGEGFTPLIAAGRLGEALGLPHLYIKDESTNPTGSFKARGL